ncbi:MAG TPA: division/cell wall cluster transcriptional repressor MraZ [Burkholderiaceae bacterium]|nr:division/cell wall cluster transcriptional repressor MraZ [Burkholderiaceae bacterium]
MFQGGSALSLDAKGRLSVPARHRDALQQQCAGQLTLTRHPDGCLLLYPRPVWEEKRREISAFPASARALQRLLLGHALDVDLDGSGRMLISPELRAAAKLEKDVLLLGMGAHFELWDRATHDALEAQALEAGLPESLGSFSF